MSSKIKVKLVRGTSPFHRSVRDDAGGLVETMVFPPGVEVEISGEQIGAVLDALGYGGNGSGGVLAEVGDKGKPLDAPSKAVEDARKAAAAKVKAAQAAKPAVAPTPSKMDLRSLAVRIGSIEASVKQLHDVVSEIEAKSADAKPAKGKVAGPEPDKAKGG